MTGKLKPDNLELVISRNRSLATAKSNLVKRGLELIDEAKKREVLAPKDLKKKYSSLTLRVKYRIGGSYDFWIGVVEGVTAAYITMFMNSVALALSKKIIEIFKSSKAEKNEFESCRFDLLIKGEHESWIVLRILRGATFRTKKTINEEDIYNAILSSLNRFRDLSHRYLQETHVLTAELSNSGDEIKLSIREYRGSASVPTLKGQIDEVRSGETIVLEI